MGTLKRQQLFIKECKSNTQGPNYISNIDLAVWDTIESSHVGRLGDEARDRAGKYVDLYFKKQFVFILHRPSHSSLINA